MTIEEQTMPAVLVQCFNDIAETYGFRRHVPSKRNQDGLGKAVRWLKEVPALSPQEFIGAQVRAIEESKVSQVSFGSLFARKQVCMLRLGADADITSAGYDDYLVYYTVLVRNVERAVKKHIPGSWYSCRDELLLDPNRKYPPWFVLMEMVDVDSIPEHVLKRFQSMIKKKVVAEPALKRLLKEKYERNSEHNKYKQRLAGWL